MATEFSSPTHDIEFSGEDRGRSVTSHADTDPRIPRASNSTAGEPRAELNHQQRKVARLIALGFDDRVIAQMTGLHWRSVWRLRRGGRVQAQISQIAALSRAVAADHAREFDELLRVAIGRLRTMLLSHKTSARVAEKLIAQVFDRNPSGVFNRQRGRSAPSQAIVGNEEIERLKQSAAAGK